MSLRSVISGAIAALAIAVLAVVWGQPLAAHPVYKKEFDTRYLKEGTALHTAWKGAGHCNACHIGGGDERKNLNAYGQAIDKILDKEDAEALTLLKKKRNPERAAEAEKKIREALDFAEKQSSDPNNKDAPTFGELINSGTLPISPDKLP